MNSKPNMRCSCNFSSVLPSVAKDKLASGGSSDVYFNMLVYRIGHAAAGSNSKLAKPAKLILGRIQKLFSFYVFHIELPFDAHIGAGLRVPHPLNIIVNSRVIIGDDCVILHNVTIGTTEESQLENLAPRVGNRVRIGTGAILIGNIQIGDDVIIGAGAIVSKDVPDRATVVGHNYILDANR